MNSLESRFARPATPGRPAGKRRASARRGFTLMEIALAMVIVGVGLLSMLELLAAGTVANVDGVNETKGMDLAKNVRERTLKSTFAEVRAMDDVTLSPPQVRKCKPGNNRITLSGSAMPRRTISFN